MTTNTVTKKYVRVRAKTKARQETVREERDTFYIAVKEKAERGEANARIRLILAEKLGCSSKQLRLVKGGTSPSKIYLLTII
jgi:uncharacterized protein YggU (UPF0235/DUF167 family)